MRRVLYLLTILLIPLVLSAETYLTKSGSYDTPPGTTAASNFYTTGIPYGSTTVSATGNTNTKAYAFYVATSLSVSKLAVQVTTLDNTNKYDICIYDNAGGFGGTGNLIADWSADGSNGIALAATGLKDVAIHQGTITMAPGWYTFVIAGNSTTAAFQDDSGSFEFRPYQKSTAITSGATANGACNSTITIPAASWALTGKVIFALHN